MRNDRGSVPARTVGKPEGDARIQNQAPRHCPARRLACEMHLPLDSMGEWRVVAVVFCELGGGSIWESRDLWVIVSSEEVILGGLISGPSFSMGFNRMSIVQVILISPFSIFF